MKTLFFLALAVPVFALTVVGCGGEAIKRPMSRSDFAQRLTRCLEAQGYGDQVLFTDWDEREQSFAVHTTYATHFGIDNNFKVYRLVLSAEVCGDHLGIKSALNDTPEELKSIDGTVIG